MLKVTWFAIVAAILFLRVQIAKFVRWVFNLPEPIVKVTPWRVVRAYIIRECPDGGYDWTFKNITDCDIDYSRPDWKESVREQVPEEWPGWRLEIRCRRGEHKKRIVVRDNEDMQFPRECRESLRRRSPRCQGLLLGAVLSTPRGEDIDIIDRVKKYIVSPGRVLRAGDLFPLDDLESLGLYNEQIKLRVMYPDGASGTLVYRFDDGCDISKLLGVCM